MGTPHPSIHPFDVRTLVLFGAWALASGSTLAQGMAPANASQDALVAAFTKADQNADGQLSPAEAKTLPAAAENFAKLDTDGDQLLSQAEFIKGLQDQ